MESEDSDAWYAAIQDEFQSIQENDVWEVYDSSELPAGRKAIGSRWVFTIKVNADGSVERYKARLVCKGFSQISGIDYDETFAPVTRYDSLRLVVALAAKTNLSLHQLDIKTAFLYGELDEEIWMSPPPGLGLKGKVLRLKKALYGLKQAPLKWYEKLTRTLSTIGFHPTHFDPCVFVHTDSTTYIVVYVDDLTIASKNQSSYQKLLNLLKSVFKVSEKGPLSWILGIEVLHSKDGITLSQSTYAKQILERFQLENAKTVSTPMDPNSHLLKANEDETPHEQNLYQQMIGSLMYLVTGTRPDLAHSVSFLSQFSSNPQPSHHSAVKRVFKYLNGTRNFSLFFPRDGKLQLIGYSDADHGKNLSDRKSYSGYVFLLGNCPISWLSKKQTSVAISTTEAEYMAMSLTARQAIWYRNGFKEFKLTVPITLLTDSQSGMKLANNPILQQRTKHIAIHYHFTRERLQAGDFQLDYVPSEENLADLLTKGLHKSAHLTLCDKLGLRIEREC